MPSGSTAHRRHRSRSRAAPLRRARASWRRPSAAPVAHRGPATRAARPRSGPTPRPPPCPRPPQPAARHRRSTAGSPPLRPPRAAVAVGPADEHRRPAVLATRLPRPDHGAHHVAGGADGDAAGPSGPRPAPCPSCPTASPRRPRTAAPAARRRTSSASPAAHAMGCEVRRFCRTSHPSSVLALQERAEELSGAGLLVGRLGELDGEEVRDASAGVAVDAGPHLVLARRRARGRRGRRGPRDRAWLGTTAGSRRPRTRLAGSLRGHRRDRR